LSGEISLGFVRIQFLLLWKDSDKPTDLSAEREIYYPQNYATVTHFSVNLRGQSKCHYMNKWMGNNSW